MGTKNCPETPRQKMINVMYLVLTAMLALNVDKEVLNAFAAVDQSFVQTIKNMDSKNQLVYNDFQAKTAVNKQKFEADYEKSLKVKANAESLYRYIDSLKVMLVKAVDGEEGDINNIVSKSDLNITPNLMINKKNGNKLRLAIEAYRDELIAVIDTTRAGKSVITSINKSLDTSKPVTKDGSTPTWEDSKFLGYPLIAVITLMSKMQSDVRNAEADVINYLSGKKDAVAMKFDDLQAVVLPTSTYVLAGNAYEARIFLTAVDATVIPEVYVGNSKLPFDPKLNASIYKFITSNDGKSKYTGRIDYKKQDGSIMSLPFESEYEVAKPSMTVSPTRMNVFYLGLDNPVSISVPGISANNLIPTITNGTIQKGPDGYFVRPDKIGVDCKITVSAMIDGQSKEIGTTPFRVKKVPDPLAYVAGKMEGLISKSELLAQQGIFAKIPDFDFEMKFTVQSFSVSTSKGGFVIDEPAKGNKFTKEQINLFNALNKGSRLYIESIVVKGDDGTTRSLPPINFKIN
ncbi:MAG: gliding motility protein GldM [Mariniphaga sp.]